MSRLFDVFEELMQSELEQARERRVLGLVTGIVTDILDDNSYEVSYLHNGENTPSTPARVMMPMAGSGRGTYFFPLKGDEVVVGFELGDPTRPVILGAVWNRDAKPPSQANPSPQNDFRTIVSRSGHELTFDDTDGAGKITLRLSNGHLLEMDEAAGTVTLKTAGGRQLVFDDTIGSITLDSPGSGKIEIQDLTGSLAISAPTSISLRSQSIDLRATTIMLTTTGVVTTSMVVIDTKPFGLHTHVPPLVPAPPPPHTGPVGPL